MRSNLLRTHSKSRMGALRAIMQKQKLQPTQPNRQPLIRAINAFVRQAKRKCTLYQRYTPNIKETRNMRPQHRQKPSANTTKRALWLETVWEEAKSRTTLMHPAKFCNNTNVPMFYSWPKEICSHKTTITPPTAITTTYHNYMDLQ